METDTFNLCNKWPVTSLIGKVCIAHCKTLTKPKKQNDLFSLRGWQKWWDFLMMMSGDDRWCVFEFFWKSLMRPKSNPWLILNLFSVPPAMGVLSRPGTSGIPKAVFMNSVSHGKVWTKNVASSSKNSVFSTSWMFGGYLGKRSVPPPPPTSLSTS